ncbi:MAG TPA: amino acid ABC transporter permease [Usitatibacter sp.]|nr:amino acid ABC transporter permease [Usitatibacter sp.]
MYHWNWGVFFAPTGTGDTYLGWLLSGFGLTVALGLVAWVIALVLGIGVGVARTLPQRPVSILAAAYVELLRDIPLMVQLFTFYFVVPELLPAEMGMRVKRMNPLAQQFLAAAICLGLYTSARIAEQVRAGIGSLASGPRNSALALGLTLPQAYRHVLLPLALRIIMPPLSSEFMTVFKNSAVASMIGLLELAAQGRQLVDYTSQPYEAFIAVTALYLVLNMSALRVMRWVEARTRVPGFATVK